MTFPQFLKLNNILLFLTSICKQFISVVTLQISSNEISLQKNENLVDSITVLIKQRKS